ncbi:MAG: DUF951 domain-containing protein [Dehalococcoidia bacterium]|nr:DUF951 domain-containing protein [Dehalococcoidia bacterium]
MEPDVQTGDTVTLRKPHPCGGKEWMVTRTGADIGLKCLHCGHVVFLSRYDFRRRVKTIRSQPADTESNGV